MKKSLQFSTIFSMIMIEVIEQFFQWLWLMYSKMLLMVTLYESEIAMFVQLIFTSKCNGELIGLNVG